MMQKKKNEIQDPTRENAHYEMHKTAKIYKKTKEKRSNGLDGTKGNNLKMVNDHKVTHLETHKDLNLCAVGFLFLLP